MSKTEESDKKEAFIKDPMAVTWAENYSDEIEYYWNKLPNFLKTFLATLAIFLMGISINGKLLFFLLRISDCQDFYLFAKICAKTRNIKIFLTLL